MPKNASGAKPKIIAFSYLRFSTGEQAKGDSTRRQAAAAEEWCRRNEAVLDARLHMDPAISAFRGKNARSGALAEFLAAVRAKDVPAGSYLLIEDFDRLSRDFIDNALTLFLEILKAGVSIVTLGFGGRVFNTETLRKDPSAMYISMGSMVRAHEESQRKSDLVSAAWGAKRNRLDVQRLTRTCPAWLRPADGPNKFEVIEGRGELIRWMFEQYLEGHGTEKIANMLQDRREPIWDGRGRTARVWRQSYIEKVLINRAVLGEFQPHRLANGARVPAGEVIKEYYPQIVSPELFHSAQARRKGNRKRPGRVGTGVSNLFTHIAICSRTGAPALFHNKGRHTFLYAEIRRLDDGRRLRGWRYEDFERRFLETVGGLDLTQILKIDRSQTAELNSAAAAATAELATVRDRIRNLTEAVALGSKSRETLVRKLDEEIDEEQRKQSALDEIDAKLSAANKSSEDAKKVARDLKTLIANRTDPKTRFRLREEIRRIVDRIEVTFEVAEDAANFAGRQHMEEALAAMIAMRPAKDRSKLKILGMNGDAPHLRKSGQKSFTIVFKSGITRTVTTAADRLVYETPRDENGRFASVTILSDPGSTAPGSETPLLPGKNRRIRGTRTTAHR